MSIRPLSSNLWRRTRGRELAVRQQAVFNVLVISPRFCLISTACLPIISIEWHTLTFLFKNPEGCHWTLLYIQIRSQISCGHPTECQFLPGCCVCTPCYVRASLGGPVGGSVVLFPFWSRATSLHTLISHPLKRRSSVVHPLKLILFQVKAPCTISSDHLTFLLDTPFISSTFCDGSC